MDTFEWLSSEALLRDSSWWDIYESSFPSVELEPRELLLNSVENKILKIARYQYYKETVAIVVMQPMHSLPFTFLNYFAISRQHRNRLLGSRLFAMCLTAGEQFVREYSQLYLGLFWEVENPDAEPNPEEKVLKQRRIRFYKRHGARSFQKIFMQPTLEGKPVLMRLMYHGQLLNEALELEITKAIYLEKYYHVNRVQKDLVLYLYQESVK